MAGEQPVRSVLSAQPAYGGDVGALITSFRVRWLPVDEHERTGGAVPDSGLCDRDDYGDEAIDAIQEPADIEPAVLRVDQPGSGRLAVSASSGVKRCASEHSNR